MSERKREKEKGKHFLPDGPACPFKSRQWRPIVQGRETLVLETKTYTYVCVLVGTVIHFGLLDTM